MRLRFARYTFYTVTALEVGWNLLRIAARTAEEQRFLVIGMIADKHWSAVITYRQETIRLISVRRSRAREVQAYEGK